MAYIDENNNLSAGNGKDPIGELDAELEQLMAQLGKLESNADEEKTPARPSSEAPEPEEENLDVKEEAPKPEKKDEPDEKRRKPEEQRLDPMPEPPKKRGKGMLITIVALLIIGAVAVGIWGVYRVLSSKVSDHINLEKPKVETVAFTDSELGEITVKKVEGASLNTYDNGNLVKNEQGFYQYVENGKVTSEAGIDLAEYQGDVDFKAVKNSGIDFVILRIGGRYYSEEGAMYTDGLFDTYYEQAKAAGLKVGAYFFSQATNAAEAAEEAGFVLEKLNGRKLDYPVAFDWEIIEDDSARTDNISGGVITAMAKAFCDTIEAANYRSIVYSSTSLMLQSYNFETMKDYDFWLADYREVPNMYYDFSMWQYATDGVVDGISGTVDLNICLKPY